MLRTVCKKLFSRGRVRPWVVLYLSALPVMGTMTALSSAQITLANVLTDHMVMQRDRPVPLWGNAKPGETIRITLGEEHATATADSLGRWSLQLAPHNAGGPYEVTVEGSSKVVLNDILFGDLWLASGQSNMEMPLSGFGPETPIYDSAKEIANANYPQIRLLQVKQAASQYPLDQFKTKTEWMICSPKTAAGFSAVAYFFGRELHEDEKVPIGLIDSAWGGTPAEAWVSLEGLASSPALRQVIQARSIDMNREEALLLQKKLDAEAIAQGRRVPKRSSDPLVHWEPAALWNAMIAPLTKLPIRGVIWYQGEANANSVHAAQYADLFRSLITDWRLKWNELQMPFLFVQLAAFDTGDIWPALREAQRQALILPATGMAVAIDVGEEKNIHPAHKQEVGHRLAIAAEAISYGDSRESIGPSFSKAVNEKDILRVEFDHASGLQIRGSTQGAFEVAGADKVFHFATVTLGKDALLLQSPEVPYPIYARYSWAGFPRAVNLYNGAGLPMVPFNSELSQPEKQ